MLDNAISSYLDCGAASVALAGFADTSGPVDYNLDLSQRRADAVPAVEHHARRAGAVGDHLAHGAVRPHHAAMILDAGDQRIRRERLSEQAQHPAGLRLFVERRLGGVVAQACGNTN